MSTVTFVLPAYNENTKNQYKEYIKYLDLLSKGIRNKQALPRNNNQSDQKRNYATDYFEDDDDKKQLQKKLEETLISLYKEFDDWIKKVSKFTSRTKAAVESFVGYLSDIADVIENNDKLKSKLLQKFQVDGMSYPWIIYEGNDIYVKRSIIINNKENQEKEIYFTKTDKENENIDYGYELIESSQMEDDLYNLRELIYNMTLHISFLFTAIELSKGNSSNVLLTEDEITNFFYPQKKQTEKSVYETVKEVLNILSEQFKEFDKQMQLQISDIRSILETVETSEKYVNGNARYNHAMIDAELIQPLRDSLSQLNPENFGIMADTMQQLGLVGNQPTNLSKFAEGDDALHSLHTKKYHSISIATHIVEAYQKAGPVEEDVVRRLEVEWPSDHFLVV